MEALQEEAQTITKLHTELLLTAGRSLSLVIEIGKRLCEVKSKLEHGEFLPWIELNCPFVQRTAWNYMKAYERLVLERNPHALLSSGTALEMEPHKEMTITEAYLKAGIKRMLRTEKTGADTTGGEPVKEVKEKELALFRKPTAGGTKLKRYRVLVANGRVEIFGKGIGEWAGASLYLNELPGGEDLFGELLINFQTAFELYFSRVEEYEDKGIIQKPVSTRLSARTKQEGNDGIDTYLTVEQSTPAIKRRKRKHE